MGDNIEEPPFPLTDVDKWILSLTDEQYKYHDWEDLRNIVSKYRLIYFISFDLFSSSLYIMS